MTDLEKNINETQTASATTSVAPPLNPPTYDSIFGKIKAERDKTSDNSEFVRKSFSIMAKSIGFTILLACFLIIPIAMIVIGALNLGNCDVQRFIPIWMVVSGCTSGLMQLFNIFKSLHYCKQNDHESIDESDQGSSADSLNGLLGCFNFAWFITGNIWVFGVYQKVDLQNKYSSDYCDYLVYTFSFWVIVCSYIIIGLFCCGGCCICACLGSSGRRTN